MNAFACRCEGHFSIGVVFPKVRCHLDRDVHIISSVEAIIDASKLVLVKDLVSRFFRIEMFQDAPLVLPRIYVGRNLDVDVSPSLVSFED